MTNRLDPDDTEGRALYRARANAEARLSFGMSRKMKMKPSEDVGRPVNIHHGPIADPKPKDDEKSPWSTRPSHNQRTETCVE